ncbi:MAG: anthranilate phosphoribosyltransferase [Terrimicrobiaceae bacterium]|nr:anthranilate phosphoribosyltransferase [Terrimicrobiaceae bacterium]
MIDQLTQALRDGRDLEENEIRLACDFLFDEGAPLERRAAFLQSLHEKGESPAEIAAFVRILLERAIPLPFSGEGCLDVCGTGGDRAGLFNVSTATMLVAAACGSRVVKHGNRGITSRAGGADVLEALGVSISLPPDRAAAALDAAGCCFLFAPAYHPAFKAVAPVRKLLAERGLRSVFNMLGPLLNPARPSFQLAGVYDPRLLETYAGVFELLGRRRTWTVHGTTPTGHSLDEISPLGRTDVVETGAGGRKSFQIFPETFGIRDVRMEELTGADAAGNAGIIADLVAGNRRDGARSVVQINSAAALVVCGLASDLQAGWTLAGDALDNGSARDVLDRLRSCR